MFVGSVTVDNHNEPIRQTFLPHRVPSSETYLPLSPPPPLLPPSPWSALTLITGIYTNHSMTENILLAANPAPSDKNIASNWPPAQAMICCPCSQRLHHPSRLESPWCVHLVTCRCHCNCPGRFQDQVAVLLYGSFSAHYNFSFVQIYNQASQLVARSQSPPLHPHSWEQWVLPGDLPRWHCCFPEQPQFFSLAGCYFWSDFALAVWSQASVALDCGHFFSVNVTNKSEIITIIL